METRLVFEKGNRNDKIFVKHTGVSDYEIKKQDYSATFIQATNDVKIIKPIFGEEFMITVLVGKKGTFDEVKKITGKIYNTEFKPGWGQDHKRHDDINHP